MEREIKEKDMNKNNHNYNYALGQNFTTKEKENGKYIIVSGGGGGGGVTWEKALFELSFSVFSKKWRWDKYKEGKEGADIE